MDEKTIEALIDALKFYRDGFHPVVDKKVRGITYRPTGELTDDCGQRAMDALKLAGRS